MRPPSDKATYIGDGVYAEVEGDSVVLTTWNGVFVDSQIYLGVDEINALSRFIEDHNAAPNGPQEG